MTDLPPEAEVRPVRRSFLERISVVWLVPLAALVIALGVAWQTWQERGPLITVLFEDASGVHAGETELRYRDVVVGVVERVSFTRRLDQVAVEIRLEKDIAHYVDAESQFWVVRPEVTTQGVTGLETVLSGVYLEGLWDTEPGGVADEFEGSPSAPLLAGGLEGLRVLLRTSSDSLSGNTPLLYKGVEVGRVGEASVSLDGFTVEAEAVIYSPYDALVTEETRFWDTSGFSFSVGTGGAAVDFESLATLLAGGVTFDTFVSGAPLAEEDHVFEVFGSPDEARSSVFNRADGPELNLMAIFDGNVSGLTAGAPVEIDGLRIGQVAGLNGVVEVDATGAEQVRLQTLLSIVPARLGFEGQGAAEAALAYLQGQVEDGLRARLATANILTGGLKVQLTMERQAEAGAIDMAAQPYPSVPTTASQITDVSASAEDALERINNLPIEELLDNASLFLQSSALLVASEETQAIPGEIRAILADLRQVSSAEGTQALPDQMTAILAEVEEAAGAIAALVTALEEQEAVGRLVASVDGIDAAIAAFDERTAGLPELIDQVTTLAGTASALPLDALIAELTGVATEARAFVGSEAAQALPDSALELLVTLDDTILEAQTLVASVGEQQGVERLLTAIDNAAATASALEEAVAGVPALVANLDTVAANAAAVDLAAIATDLGELARSAAALDLDQLVAEYEGIATDVRTLLASEAAQALPDSALEVLISLDDTIVEAQTLVASVTEQEGVERLLTAIDNAAAAAGGIEEAVAGVPALVASLERVATNAGEVDLAQLGAQLSVLAGRLGAFLGSEGVDRLPAEVNATLVEVQALLSDLTEAEVGTSLGAALDAATGAAGSVEAAVAGVPAVVERIDAVAAQAQALELQALADQVETILGSADALLSSPTTQDLPGELGRTLSQISATLEQFREAGGVDNANAVLVSARTAADRLAASVETLPALIARANTVLASTDSTVTAYGENGTLARDLRQALREVAQAAEALTSLARTIERQPNSLILGR